MPSGRCYGPAAVILVGLTGGIGAGKSTVSQLLAEHGAVIIDADAITRQLQEPGQPVLAAIVERFGSGILTAEGALDRPALAELVFNDPDALKDLNGLVHPAVGKEIARRIDMERDSDRVVVLDVPLLVETGRRGMAGVVVVDAPLDVAVDRLVRHRGMSEADALARMARQASREERRAQADWVVDNAGPRADLVDQVDRLWAWLQTLPPADPPDGARRLAPTARRARRRPGGAESSVPIVAKSCRRVQELLTPSRTSAGSGVALPIRPTRRTHPGDGIAPLTDLGPMGPSHGAGRAPARRRSPVASSSSSASTAGWCGRGSPRASSPSPGRVCSYWQELRPRSSSA